MKTISKNLYEAIKTLADNDFSLNWCGLKDCGVCKRNRKMVDAIKLAMKAYEEEWKRSSKNDGD